MIYSKKYTQSHAMCHKMAKMYTLKFCRDILSKHKKLAAQNSSSFNFRDSQ